MRPVKCSQHQQLLTELSTFQLARRLLAFGVTAQGLHPSNMFACGMDFLLRLKPEALAHLTEQYQLVADPAPLKIGIHIRVGDQQLVRG